MTIIEIKTAKTQIINTILVTKDTLAEYSSIGIKLITFQSEISLVVYTAMYVLIQILI